MDLTYYDLIRIPSPECEECGGEGEWHTVIRWDHRGCGGPAPVEKWSECEACYGTGLEGCYRHPEEAIIAHNRHEEDATYCSQCIATMIRELEQYGQEGLCDWSEALQIRETIAGLKAMLEAYEMEVAA